MTYLFAAFRLFPIWAIPMALVCAEIGWFYRRKRDTKQWLYWGLTGFWILMTIIWVIARGDIHSDDWVRSLTGQG